jgi:DNA replication protein DnaC
MSRQRDSLGYVDFLEVLLKDEVQRRANKSLAARIAHAHFEEIKTIEKFNFSFNPQ